MVVPLSREEWVELLELEWHDAVRRGEPQAKCDALELLWREWDDGAALLLNFIERTTPGMMRPNHLRSVAELLPRMRFGRVRALISAPPRHSKTLTLANMIILWMLWFPEKTAAYISYAADVAEEKSRIMRDLAGRVGIVLRKDANKLSTWRNPSGGGLIAVGIDGQLTSKGVDLLVVDDPYSGRSQAESLVERAHVNTWLTGTALTRLEPGASVIIAHARWHIGDIIGVLKELNKPKWDLINLPAINDKGEPLWPERWPLEELMIRKTEIVAAGGEHDWASLFMGEPMARGEQLFNEPARYQQRDVEGTIIVISCDPATTPGGGDNSAIVVLSGKLREDQQILVQVLDVRAMRVDAPTLVRELQAVQTEWRGAPIVIEAVGGFKGIPQTLRSISRNLRITELNPVKSKYIRAQPVAAAWNEGRVLVPLEADWAGSLIAECKHFSGAGDERDDRVDALAHGFNELVSLLMRRRTPIETFERLAMLG